VQPDCGQHGEVDDEDQEDADRVLERGGDHGGVHPQPCAHQGPKGQDTIQTLAWKQA